MSKRSNFKRVPKDKYMTFDPRPVQLLQPHLPPRTAYAEPCAGNGDLIKSMAWHGHLCVYSCDTHPGKDWIEKRDARDLNRTWRRGAHADMFISNLPWSRKILHELIEHLTELLPTVVLLDADWMHTRQASELLDRCKLIVSVGRVRWIKETEDVGKDNVCWYFFQRTHTGGPRFTGLI